MKKTLFLFIAVLVLLASCQKKKTVTGCYACQWIKVQYSTYQVFNKQAVVYAIDTVCNMNSGLLTMYEQTHTYYDTLQNSHDTLTYVYNSMQCNVE